MNATLYFDWLRIFSPLDLLIISDFEYGKMKHIPNHEGTCKNSSLDQGFDGLEQRQKSGTKQRRHIQWYLQ